MSKINPKLLEILHVQDISQLHSAKISESDMNNVFQLISENYVSQLSLLMESNYFKALTQYHFFNSDYRSLYDEIIFLHARKTISLDVLIQTALNSQENSKQKENVDKFIKYLIRKLYETNDEVCLNVLTEIEHYLSENRATFPLYEYLIHDELECYKPNESNRLSEFFSKYHKYKYSEFTNLIYKTFQELIFQCIQTPKDQYTAVLKNFYRLNKMCKIFLREYKIYEENMKILSIFSENTKYFKRNMKYITVPVMYGEEIIQTLHIPKQFETKIKVIIYNILGLQEKNYVSVEQFDDLYRTYYYSEKGTPLEGIFIDTIQFSLLPFVFMDSVREIIEYLPIYSTDFYDLIDDLEKGYNELFEKYKTAENFAIGTVDERYKIDIAPDVQQPIKYYYLESLRNGLFPKRALPYDFINRKSIIYQYFRLKESMLKHSLSLQDTSTPIVVFNFLLLSTDEEIQRIKGLEQIIKIFNQNQSNVAPIIYHYKTHLPLFKACQTEIKWRILKPIHTALLCHGQQDIFNFYTLLIKNLKFSPDKELYKTKIWELFPIIIDALKKKCSNSYEFENYITILCDTFQDYNAQSEFMKYLQTGKCSDKEQCRLALEQLNITFQETKLMKCKSAILNFVSKKRIMLSQTSLLYLIENAKRPTHTYYTIVSQISQNQARLISLLILLSHCSIFMDFIDRFKTLPGSQRTLVMYMREVLYQLTFLQVNDSDYSKLINEYIKYINLKGKNKINDQNQFDSTDFLRWIPKPFIENFLLRYNKTNEVGVIIPVEGNSLQKYLEDYLSIYKTLSLPNFIILQTSHIKELDLSQTIVLTEKIPKRKDIKERKREYVINGVLNSYTTTQRTMHGWCEYNVIDFKNITETYRNEDYNLLTFPNEDPTLIILASEDLAYQFPILEDLSKYAFPNFTFYYDINTFRPHTILQLIDDDDCADKILNGDSYFIDMITNFIKTFDRKKMLTSFRLVQKAKLMIEAKVKKNEQNFSVLEDTVLKLLIQYDKDSDLGFSKDILSKIEKYPECQNLFIEFERFVRSMTYDDLLKNIPKIINNIPSLLQSNNTEVLDHLQALFEQAASDHNIVKDILKFIKYYIRKKTITRVHLNHRVFSPLVNKAIEIYLNNKEMEKKTLEYFHFMFWFDKVEDKPIISYFKPILANINEISSFRPAIEKASIYKDTCIQYHLLKYLYSYNSGLLNRITEQDKQVLASLCQK